MTEVRLLPDGVRRVTQAAERSAEDLAEFVAGEWRRTAPVGDPATDPHAGRYRDNIRVVTDGDGSRVETDAPEWAFLEFGTVHMAPQPSALPALAVGLSRVNDVVGARLRRDL